MTDAPEPKMVELILYRIQTHDFDIDTSWIKGELLLRINCEDGIALLYYVPGWIEAIDERLLQSDSNDE